MNICGHFIADDQITGIGPLMVDFKTFNGISVGNSKKLSFKIYLKGFAAPIESDFFNLGTGDPDESEKEARKAFQNFKDQYYKIRATISKRVEKDGVVEIIDPR